MHNIAIFSDGDYLLGTGHFEEIVGFPWFCGVGCKSFLL